jgi:hypothetical protein
MLKARSRPLIMALAAGALTLSGAAAALAAGPTPGGDQRASDGQTTDAGDDINPLCMLRPQDCMYPPDDRNGDGNRQPNPEGGGFNPLCMLRPQDCMYPPGDRNGEGNRQPSPDGGGMNPLCLFRPQECWPPPGQDGKGDGDTPSRPGGGRLEQHPTAG